MSVIAPLNLVSTVLNAWHLNKREQQTLWIDYTQQNHNFGYENETGNNSRSIKMTFIKKKNSTMWGLQRRGILRRSFLWQQ